MRNLKVFIINGFVLAATSIFLRMIDVAFNAYISNKVGTEGMGLFQLIMSVYMFAINFALSGVGLACTRLVAEELACNHEAGAKKAVRRCLLYSAVFGTAAMVLLFSLSEYIAVHILRNELTILPLKVLAFSLPFMAMASAISGYFIAVRRPAKNAAADILEKFVRITIVVFILVYFMPDGVQYACLAIALGGMLSEAANCLFLAFLYVWDKKRYQNTNTGKHITKRMVGIALPVALSTYLRSGLSTIKHLMIPLGLQGSGITKAAALSQYGIIQGMVMPVIMFPSAFISAFGSLMIPEIARFHVRKDYRNINYAISKIFKFTLLFSICVAGILICYSGPIAAAIYKTDEVSYFIRILAPLVVIMYFDEVVDGLLKGINKQVSVVRINIIDTACCIGLIYLLLPRFGLNGYITVIFISELLNGFLSISRLMRSLVFKLELVDWVVKPLCSITVACYISLRIPTIHFTVNILITAALYLFLQGMFYLMQNTSPRLRTVHK